MVMQAYGAAPMGGVPVVRLFCRSGEFANSTFTLVPNDRIMIGRQSGCNIRFASSTPNVSRHHCTVEFDGNTVWITDNNSSYGTFFDNGVRFTALRRTAISRGKGFYLGSRDILFEIM